jgi:hypothetical protein
VTFSETMRPPPALAITVKDPSGAVVDGTTAFNAGTLTATFKPSGPLELSTTYTATVVGSDLAGNPVSAPPTWSFSTSTCPCSLWTDTTTPAVASENDPHAVELGLHFSASRRLPERNPLLQGRGQHRDTYRPHLAGQR